ncbi:efflux RND transporter periplasmic adaptor subunit [Helicobacter cappadocius]|uniref:Efflux RND transporter periplasmic adaptor subunit n=1 Tax=Helicobacter cappadocius TaxID=3063998 RepID=A0AA90SST8_9HELI|nr:MULTISPECIES: efflux RND transporter periplasmic adaptor subunit [unclassified Helicobacter]MDO7253437.1 efflux RND transporter periplasmic adaptor subunit [Helicobacter sp. faydin-H75]MDP2539299.1 efflux RND transporter periplasmic adaptor subunit [Helicobacter sp. faydin-H76]
MFRKFVFCIVVFFVFLDGKPIYVNTKPIKSGTLQKQETFVGSVSFKEISNIASQSQGVVQQIYFRIGQKVKKGQKLLSIDDDLLQKDIQIKQAKLTQAQYSLQRQEKDLQRYKNLLDTQSIPLQEYENLEYQLKSQEANILALQAELEISQAERAKKTIYAPFDGIIVEQKVHVAEWVNTGEAICQILNSSDVEVIVDVPSSIAKNIKVGQNVSLIINSKHYQGKISALIPKADIRSRTFPVHIGVKNDGSFLDGMAAEAMLDIDGKSSGFIVPRDSIVNYLGSPTIFVSKNNQAIATKVEVLSIQDSQALIRGKIKENDRVVYRGQDRLQNGSDIEEKRQSKK